MTRWPRYASPGWITAYAIGAAGWALFAGRYGVLACVAVMAIGLALTVALGEWIA